MTHHEIRVPSSKTVTAAGTEAFVLRACPVAPEVEVPEQKRARALMREAREMGKLMGTRVNREKERQCAFVESLMAKCRAGTYTADGCWLATRTI